MRTVTHKTKVIKIIRHGRQRVATITLCGRVMPDKIVAPAPAPITCKVCLIKIKNHVQFNKPGPNTPGCGHIFEGEE